MSKRDKWEKLGDTVVLRCSQRGGGLYLYLSKGLTEFHEIQAGDRLRVKLLEISRLTREESEAKNPED